MTLLHFESIPIKELHEPLVDLSIYDFVLEPVYFKQGLSRDARMFLRKSVADKLIKIQNNLEGYKFKIWDGFRSREVQNAIYQKFWNEFKKDHPEWDEDRLKKEVGMFVTVANDLNRIPPHATGGAVDLTLVDPNGKALEMGTSFDYFGPEAMSFYFEGNGDNGQAKVNQKILREAMSAEDFSIDKEEWWHFDYGNQKWAIQLNKPEAFFGEAQTPNAK
ncbi:MAG: M15 family metallopeptidase [Candidatus Gracilibacteria bacterium]